MRLNEVVSSNIKAIGYDEGNLIVEYLSGAKYSYKNVPEEIFNESLNAESKGRFINTNIKGKFEYERI